MNCNLDDKKQLIVLNHKNKISVSHLEYNFFSHVEKSEPPIYFLRGDSKKELKKKVVYVADCY